VPINNTILIKDYYYFYLHNSRALPKHTVHKLQRLILIPFTDYRLISQPPQKLAIAGVISLITHQKALLVRPHPSPLSPYMVFQNIVIFFFFWCGASIPIGLF
jgi:hypothetical protein